MDLKKNSKKQKKMIPRESGTPQNPSKTKITDLPDEILESIFLKLSEKDVHRNLVLVCQRFKNIIYRPKFTPIVKIVAIPGRFDISVFEKVEKALDIYPLSKIEVVYNLIGLKMMEEWMEHCAGFFPWVSKMSLSCTTLDFRAFAKFTDYEQFETLECLDLNLEFSHALLTAKMDFRNCYPALKSLNIKAKDFEGTLVSTLIF